MGIVIDCIDSGLDITDFVDVSFHCNTKNWKPLLLNRLNKALKRRFKMVKIGQTFIINGRKFMCCNQLKKDIYAFTSIENFGNATWEEITNCSRQNYIHKPIQHEKVQAWYQGVKDIEADDYAWKPYLVSKEEAADDYNEALQLATKGDTDVENRIHGVCGTWVGDYCGNADDYYFAYYVNSRGDVLGSNAMGTFVVAPSINIDISKCQIEENRIIAK